MYLIIYFIIFFNFNNFFIYKAEKISADGDNYKMPNTIQYISHPLRQYFYFSCT